jgi:putative ABC transport system permease protein
VLRPANLPRLDAVQLDTAALLFAAGASALTALLSAVVPALRAAGLDLNSTLRAAGSATAAQVRFRRMLMVGEMALALVLLIGAGLMIRSFAALQQVNPGFDPRGVLTFRLAMPPAKYPRPAARLALLRQMEERIRALPGVKDVGMASQLPLTGSGALSPFAYNEATARNWESETSDGRNVSPTFFRAMGTRLLAGRAFDVHDIGNPNVIIVDETLAARAWPGENAVGRRLQVQPDGSDNRFAEVVGVVEHIRAHDLSRAVRPQLYRPLGAQGRVAVVVRARMDPSSLAFEVRRVMDEIDPELPLDRVAPMAWYVDDALAQARLNLLVMSFFGGAALLLSAVGIYGVFSYAISQRTREIGIRMALGQDPRSVRNEVLAQAARMTLVSAAIGIAAAALLARSVAKMLYGVNAADPVTFVSMAAILMAAALLGSYVPARRATRVDPLVALKTE